MAKKTPLTVKEVAVELGVSERRVRALIDGGNGKLRASKIGRDWLIDPADVEKVKERKPGRPWPKEE